MATFGVFALFWLLAATRHSLLQSNAYDLGLFDQWIWLASQGLPPISSMEGVHLLADHGAWALYLAVIPYRIHSSVQWLLSSQALTLSLTAIPIWLLAKQAGLKPKLCWLACGLWWLQPVVFNTNLFDFHPEVWGMPALAGSYWASRSNKPWLWFSLLVILLGCRDGLILVVLGIGLEQAWKKRWIWAFAAVGLALGWLAILTRFLYPYLTGKAEGPKAVESLFSYLGGSLDEILINIFTRPQLLIENIDWVGGIEYLVLLTIAIAPFWKKSSLPTLIGSIPLIMVNLLSEAAPQRSLIHHYSLPIAVIAVVGAIDGLGINPQQKLPWRKLAWNVAFWSVLAKPWFFSGPYLERMGSLTDVQRAIKTIPAKSRLITTSYLVPHVSQRLFISFPKENKLPSDLKHLDTILLNPKDPGWGSSSKAQKKILTMAKETNWSCEAWNSGFELCRESKSN